MLNTEKILILFSDNSEILNAVKKGIGAKKTVFMTSDSFSLFKFLENYTPTSIVLDLTIKDRLNAQFWENSNIPVFPLNSKEEVFSDDFSQRYMDFMDSKENQNPVRFEINHSQKNSDIKPQKKFNPVFPAKTNEDAGKFSPEENSEIDFPKCLSVFAGNSQLITDFKKRLLVAANSDTTILLLGETGSGKSTAASVIHELSSRKEKPLIPVSIPDIPITLVESELFGNEKGAFTDAVARNGFVQLADNGTLFLDEIGDSELAIQKKLLYFLETGNFRKVGSGKLLHADLRLIFATNANLKQKIREKEFRKDLFYRLTKFVIKIPSLKERQEDIPFLCENYLKKVGAQKFLSPLALEKLCEHDWPGNIRELENVLERAIIDSGDREIITDASIDLLDI